MSAELATREASVISADQGRLTETGLTLREDLNFNEWSAIGHDLGRAARASAWWIGDWINYGESKWGEKYDEAERLTGLSNNHLRQCASVAQRFELCDRSHNLTWTHYYRARALKDAEKWLAQAEAENWSVRELRQNAATAPRTIVMPAKRHATLVEAAAKLVELGERWQREMTDALTPPQAKKQLTVLHKAHNLLEDVIEAVEYRADTPHTFLGR